MSSDVLQSVTELRIFRQEITGQQVYSLKKVAEQMENERESSGVPKVHVL